MKQKPWRHTAPGATNTTMTKKLFTNPATNVFHYLKLQPVDPQDDGSISDLDQYAQDEVIDLTVEAEGAEIMQAWDRIEQDMHSGS